MVRPVSSEITFEYDGPSILKQLTDNLPFWVLDLLLRQGYGEDKKRIMGEIKAEWLNMIQYTLAKLNYEMKYHQFRGATFFEDIKEQIASIKDFKEFEQFYNFNLPLPETPSKITQEYWGPRLWAILHCISIVLQDYPAGIPTFAKLVYLINHIMLCGYCVKNYESLDREQIYLDIIKNPVIALFNLHSTVNLHTTTRSFTWEDFKTKYGLTERSR